jgi:hypothetical protein
MSQRRITEIVAQARARLIGQGDRAGRRLARRLREIENEILWLMSQQRGKVSRAQIARLLRRIDRVVAAARPDVAAFLRSELPNAALIGMETQARILATAYGVKKFSQIPARRVVDTFLQFERDVRARRILAVSDEALMQRWADLYDDHMRRTTRRLQGEFVAAAARGDTYKALAAAVERPLGGLQLSGRMNSDAFALGFTRAKLTEIASNASVRVAQDAGFDRFRNYGIADGRQSSICAAASAAEPMSKAEWDASIYGPPPRHVLNCRCNLGIAPVKRERLDEREVLARVAQRAAVGG